MVSAPRGCQRVNNTIAAPAGRFPLFDNGQQQEDGTYARENNTPISIGSRHPRLPPPPPLNPRAPRHLDDGEIHNNISRSFSTTASNHQQQDSIQTRERHALTTKTSSPPCPAPPSPPQSLLLVNLTHPPPISLHPPFDERANRVERSISHQQNHRVPHNQHKSHRKTKHARTHTHSTVRRLTRQEQHEAFFFIFILLIILTHALPPSSSSNSDAGSRSGPCSPPTPLRYVYSCLSRE